MKNKECFLRIFIILISVIIISVITLALLGKKERVGYLSEFKLNVHKTLELNNCTNIEKTKYLFTIDNKLNYDAISNYIVTNELITIYSYYFRIKYYDKVFRNSDIYGVYPNTDKILNDNNFIKKIKMHEEGSPFGSLISTKELKYNYKIDNINYVLRVKSNIIIFSAFIILLLFYNNNLSYKIIKFIKLFLFDEKYKKIRKISILAASTLIVFLFLLLYVLGRNVYKAHLEDLELIAETKSGFVYKSKINFKWLFSPNFIYKLDKISFEKKPDYVKNYGFNLELTSLPWKSSQDFTAFIDNNFEGFIVSNSSSNYTSGGYSYNIELSKGEKYIVTIEAKKISKNIGGVIKYSLNSAPNITISNTDKMTDTYQKYISELEISENNISERPAIRFAFPEGVINIKSIKIEQVSDNLCIKQGNNIILTSSKKIYYDNIDIDFTLKMSKYYYILIKLLIIVFIIFNIVFNIIDYLFNKYFSKIRFCSYSPKIYNSENQIVLLSLIAFIFVFPLIYIINQTINQIYPYYYNTENNVFTLQYILTSSNLMQNTYQLPSITPTLLYKYILIPAGKIFGVISVSSLEELSKALNPYLLYSDFMQYISITNLLILYMYSIIMYANVVYLLKDTLKHINKYVVFILLIFLNLSIFIIPNYAIHITYRPEPVGLLFLAISLSFIIATSKTNNPTKHIIYIILSGFTVGLAFLSKLSFASAILLFPFIYFILNKENNFNFFNKINISFKLSLFITIILFTIATILSNIIFKDNLIKTAFYRYTKYNIPFLFILPSIFLVYSILLYLISNNIIKIFIKNKNFIFSFNIYIISFILSIFTTLLLPNGMQTLYNTYIFAYTPFVFIMQAASSAIRFHAGYMERYILFILIIINIFVILKYNKYIINKINLYSLLIAIFSFVLTLFMNSILSRSGISLNFHHFDGPVAYSTIFISFIILFMELFNYIKYKNIFALFFTIILIFYSFLCFSNVRKFIYSNNVKTTYLYDNHYFRYGVYGRTANEYTKIMNNMYPDNTSFNYAFKLSSEIKKLKVLLKQINNNYDIGNTSIAYTGNYLSLSKDKIITEVDYRLLGNLIVKLDNIINDVYLRSDYNFYLISEKYYFIEDNRIEYLKDYKFTINGKNFFVYKLNQLHWTELNYGYDGYFKIDSNNTGEAYILLEQKF